MTAPTPTTTPVKLRSVRSLCAARIWQESTAFRERCTGLVPLNRAWREARPSRLLQFGFGVTGLDDGLILGDTTVLQHDEPASVFGHGTVVRNHDEGAPLAVQALEEAQHFGGRCGCRGCPSVHRPGG